MVVPGAPPSALAWRRAGAGELLPENARWTKRITDRITEIAIRNRISLARNGNMKRETQVPLPLSAAPAICSTAARRAYTASGLLLFLGVRRSIRVRERRAHAAAQLRDQLFRRGRERAVRFQFQIFLQGFDGSRRGDDLAAGI